MTTVFADIALFITLGNRTFNLGSSQLGHCIPLFGSALSTSLLPVFVQELAVPPTCVGGSF